MPETPVFGEPSVETVENLRARLRIVLERLLHADAEGGEQQCSGDALPVHDLDAGVRVAVLRPDRFEVAERLPDGLAFGIAPVPVVQRAGTGHRGERRIRDVIVQPAADRRPAPAADLRPAETAASERAVLMPGEGVFGLVGVEIEDPLVPHHPTMRTRRPKAVNLDIEIKPARTQAAGRGEYL
nr:hypothetical protein [Actinomadura sp. CNU-125]